MNKKIILLPFLMAGLLIGCNPSKGGSSSQQQSSGSQTSQSSEGSSGGQSQSTSEKAIWEEDLVSGESTIAQVKAGTPGEYYKVRGTVVWNSGSTLALARNGEFLYCYNFNGDSATTGNEDLKAHPLGSYVEIYGQSSEYSGSIQLTAYVNKAYDPDAKLTVLAEQGEPVAPVEVKTAEAFLNGAAAGVLAKVLYTADKDYELAANTAANTDFGGAIEGLSEDAVSTPIMRMEKYLPAEIQTALIANNPAIKEGNVYEVVGLLAATSKGSARVMLGEGSSWTLKQEKVWDEPTGVTITAAGDATEVEVGGSLQLTAVVAPATAKQNVTWAISSGTDFATIDQTGKVTGVEIGDIVVTATAKEGVAGTLNLHVKAASAKPLAAPITLDFSARTETGTYLDSIEGKTVLEVIQDAAGSDGAHITAASAKTVASGNGTGGAWENTAGLIKFGSSKAAGTLSITFDGLVNKVEITAHDWYKKSDGHPTNSNYLAVNGGDAVLAPYNETGAGEVMTFNLATPSQDVEIVSTGRVFVWTIVVSYVAA